MFLQKQITFFTSLNVVLDFCTNYNIKFLIDLFRFKIFFPNCSFKAISPLNFALNVSPRIVEQKNTHIIL